LTTVVVAGGGIAGLSAAREIERLAPAADILLLEAEDRLGGKIETLELGGATVEAGPDWFLTRNEEAVALCRELGLAGELVAPETMGARIYRRGRLVPLPDGFVRGFPASTGALARCRALSVADRLRAASDLLSTAPLRGPDVSIGSFARSRLGRGLLECLVDPILAASRSGAADELSLAASAPEIDRAARAGRSLIRQLGRTQNAGAGGHPFLGLRDGMTRLVDALVSSLTRTVIRTATPGHSLRVAPRGFRVRAGNEDIAALGVVLAVPAFAAARLLRDIDDRLGDLVGSIAYADAVVASLLYAPGAAEPPSGVSGVLVPSTEGRALTAFAWFSAKWSHARPKDGGMVMRCFLGRTESDRVADLAEDETVQLAADDLTAIAGLRHRPIDAVVTRRQKGLPVYKVGHLDLMGEIERRLPQGLALAGAGYRGSGVPDCIGQGRRAARQIMGGVRPREGS
jgi:oxygen-dependent protoporphyrinogen oxidase